MRNRSILALLGTALAVLVSSGCTEPTAEHDHSMAESVTLSDQWVSSAETGMAAMFGTFTNAGHHDVHIVGGESPAAAMVEVHEVVADATGTMAMRPKADGLTIAPGATHELTPGGDHLMLMDLEEPLQPGADVSLTVLFEDGSTLPVTAQIREFAGGNEEYQPSSPGNAEAPHAHG
ncbi:copper chaperone PCu(A)C [soil metagenome]